MGAEGWFRFGRKGVKDEGVLIEVESVGGAVDGRAVWS